jgi:hypothetical protein
MWREGDFAAVQVLRAKNVFSEQGCLCKNFAQKLFF